MLETFIIITIVFLLVIIVLFVNIYELKHRLKRRQGKIDHHMYELAILKEIGERIGYSLNVEKIVDIITGSLGQFIDYGAVSYMLLKPEKIIFKVDLAESVSRKFIDEIQSRMLASLSALLGEQYEKSQIETILTGAILDEENETPVKSYFNIPLTIGDKVVGVLTIAHSKEGLYQETEMTILYKIVKQASQAVTQLQQVVETERSKLSAMVESMAEGVIMTDKDYRIVVANPAARVAAGIDVKKAKLDIFDFIDNLDKTFDIRGKLEKSVNTNKTLISNNVLIGERIFKIFVSPVKSDQGLAKNEVLGCVVIFHDITQEKEIEKLKKDFTSMMVHELRSPLDGVKKMAELMREEGFTDNTDNYNEFVNMIYKNSSDMLELVGDLLDVAKIESGEFKIKKEKADIKQIIQQRIAFYQILAQDSKLKLTSQFAQDLPTSVDFDIRRISQVLNNFISNSIKFTKADGSVTIQALLYRQGADLNQLAQASSITWFITGQEKHFQKLPDSLVVAVTDSGAGISQENISKLFNKFKQFKAAATSEKRGTGLGLAISKGIVSAHQGTIGVASQEGKGSTFYFTIPVATQVAKVEPVRKSD